jgi:signal transduction histidine kinase
VNQILRVSNLETEFRDSTATAHDPDDIITEALETARSTCPQQLRDDVALRALTLPKKCVGITDARILKEALVSLISNAIKFTSHGFIEVGYQKEEDDLVFFVRDTGCGIKEEDKPYIFKKFFQGTSGEVALHHGTGLGLSLASRLVETMNGTLTFESRHGKGSVFYLRGVCTVTEDVNCR